MSVLFTRDMIWQSKKVFDVFLVKKQKNAWKGLFWKPLEAYNHVESLPFSPLGCWNKAGRCVPASHNPWIIFTDSLIKRPWSVPQSLRHGSRGETKTINEINCRVFINLEFKMIITLRTYKSLARSVKIVKKWRISRFNELCQNLWLIHCM